MSSAVLRALSTAGVSAVGKSKVLGFLSTLCLPVGSRGQFRAFLSTPAGQAASGSKHGNNKKALPAPASKVKLKQKQAMKNRVQPQVEKPFAPLTFPTGLGPATPAASPSTLGSASSAESIPVHQPTAEATAVRGAAANPPAHETLVESKPFKTAFAEPTPIPSSVRQRTLFQSYAALPRQTRMLISFAIVLVGIGGMALSDYMEKVMPPGRSSGIPVSSTSDLKPEQRLEEGSSNIF